MKKILSFLLCSLMAFSAMSGIVLENSPADISVTAEAASYNKKMLPYCYNKLTEKEQNAYLKIRTAFINHENSVKIEIPTDTADKIAEIMMNSDVLTSFNFPTGEDVFQYLYYEETGLTESIEFHYNFSKKNYDTIIKKADEAAEKVMSKFTDKTSKYTKIKYIHDYIINNSEYDLTASMANNIYGALVKGKAKCDGYAHAFNYICQKAGIRTVTVLGRTVDSNADEYHVWNKVYYNKKWYNVDVTWDDPVNNLKENICYNYFMISDKAISGTHTQSDVSYYVPKASSDGMDYYNKYGLYAKSISDAKDILVSEIAAAAKEGKSSATVCLSSSSLCASLKDRFENTEDMFSILERAAKKSKVKIITDGYMYNSETDVMNTFTVYFYYPKTNLSDYYINISEVDKETADFLADLGIKNK